MRENIRALGVLMKREIRMLAGHRIYWFVMIFAPLFCFLFFMDLLKDACSEINADRAGYAPVE